MALPRRAPREVYTVFSESDFMAGAEGADIFAPDTSEAGRRRLGRVAGPALMAAVLAAIVVTILAHRAPGPAPRRPGGPASSSQASRAAQPRSQRVGAPTPVLVSARGSRTGLSARRPTVGLGGRNRTVAASWRNQSQISGEVAQSAITPSETAEFGFER
jgi:hypothetical protein